MLQWMDNFRIYGTDASRFSRLTNGPYAEAAGGSAGGDLSVDPDPTAGGFRVLSMGGNANSIVRKVLTAAQTVVGVAYRLWLSAIPAASNNALRIASFCDQNNVEHGYLTIDASGFLQYNRTDSTGDVNIASSISPVVIANAWNHYEIKVVFDAAAGSVEVRREGYTVLYVAGVRTTRNTGAIASCYNVAFRNTYFLGPTLYFKDLIIWDGTGAYNNDFIGSCQVYEIFPDGDTTMGWNTSAGATAYNLINDANPDDDTGYISAPLPLPANPVEVTMTDLPLNVTSVRGVMSIHRSRKTDGGDGQIQSTLIYGASNSAGADRTITTAFTYWWDMFERAPGNVQWTKAIVDALRMKLNRTV